MSKTIPLEQLIALNDEIAALTRAGVPLDRGLVDLGHDLPGRLGKLTVGLGQRLEAGESLSQVLARAEPAFPPLYRAVVEAGLRSGRLAVALEGISTTSRRVAQLRRAVGLALLYPLILLAVLYVLLLFSITKTLPILLEAYEWEATARGGWIGVLGWLAENASWWAPWPPLLFGTLLGLCWYRSGQAGSAVPASGWFPTFGQLLHAGHTAAFAEVLALLVEQKVPLDEAVVLAGDASGDRRLARAGRELAGQIRQGETARCVPAGFPPLLGWMIVSGRQQTDLSGSLRQAAEGYRERAQRLADWMAIYLPIWLGAGVGGMATLVYALMVLGPWFQLLYEWA